MSKWPDSKKKQKTNLKTERKKIFMPNQWLFEKKFDEKKREKKNQKMWLKKKKKNEKKKKENEGQYELFILTDFWVWDRYMFFCLAFVEIVLLQLLLISSTWGRAVH